MAEKKKKPAAGKDAAPVNDRAAKLKALGVTMEHLEKDFVDFCAQRGIVGIKGHRSVGGFRASLYNALPMESVDALVEAMNDFEATHK